MKACALDTMQVTDLMSTYGMDNPKWSYVDPKLLNMAAPRSNCVLSINKLKCLFPDFKIQSEDYQGVSIINYPSNDVAWTRIIQHKHFHFSKSPMDFITYEYSKQYNKNDPNQIPYYPINTEENNLIYKQYKLYAEKEHSKLIVGGRLGNYRYYDMDMTVANALSTVKKELEGI